jgi:hypothetical protein
MTLRQEIALLLRRHCFCESVDTEMLLDELLRIIARERLAAVRNSQSQN